jgi:hypothetical protein
MKPLSACHISEHQRDAWLTAFVPAHEPFFLQSDHLVNALLRSGAIIYTRAEFLESFPRFALDYGSIYHLWDIPRETSVWVADVTQRQQIDAQLLQDVLQEQVRLHRGQIYDDAWYPRIQTVATEYGWDEARWQQIFQRLDDASTYILTHERWRALPQSVRGAWLLAWLEEQLVNDAVLPINPEQLAIPAAHRPLVMRYAGYFADASGANCFAATLALATGNMERADSIIHLWLHQEPFLRALQAQGYAMVAEALNQYQRNVISPLDALLWLNQDGQLVHAAFCIAPDHVFNKMGQSWEQPWLVLRLDDVFGYNDVLTTGGKLLVYRKQ